MWKAIMAVLPTVLVCLALAGVVFLIIRKMVRDKRQGKSSCGCNCGGCPMSGKCHNSSDQ